MALRAFSSLRTSPLYRLWLAPDLVPVVLFTILPMMTSLACLRFRIPPLRLDDFDAFWSSLTSVTYVMLQKNFAIQVTRCNLLAVLTGPGTGETALFTFSRLIPVSKLLRVTLEDFISNVSDHISVTWDVQIDPDKLDLRWHDSSGDTFVLRNTNLCHLLHMHRPQWCQHQDTGNLFPPRPFADFNELCIMRPILP